MQTIRGLSLFAIAGVLCIVVSVSCGARQKCQDPAQRNTIECAVVNSVVDCTTEQAQALIAQFEPVVLSLIAKLTGADGSIDWGALTDAVKTFGIADGMCVLSTAVEELTKKSTHDGASGKPKYDSLSLGFDQLRAKVSPGIRYHTKLGDL